jgi:alpha-glucosidase
VLAQTRRFLRWRKEQPALCSGSKRFLEAPEPILMFVRRAAAQTMLCAFNLGPAPASFTPPAPVEALSGHGFAAEEAGRDIKLPGHGVFFGTIIGEGDDG